MSIYDRAKDALSKARFDEVNDDLMPCVDSSRQ